jgi:chromosomal replication initiation ATPase DnaA
MSADCWSQVLEHLRAELEGEDFRRWFAGTAYASDSGDQITVWVPSEPIRRHLQTHYQERIDRALEAIDRPEVHIRFVVAGYGEDEELEE